MTFGEYLVCKYCGRTFIWDDIVEMHEEPFKINHVLIEPPEWYKCPNEDCNGRATNSYSWEEVRKYHPEYPEIPDEGVKYSTEELLEEEIRAYDEEVSGLR